MTKTPTPAAKRRDEGQGRGCQHKNDALTPQEYLKACDLGIQNRSRIYIRARLMKLSA